MIRFIDLFCGLGGFRIALKKQECVFSCDNDKSVSDVYYNNFNENPFEHTINTWKIYLNMIFYVQDFLVNPFQLLVKEKVLTIQEAHCFLIY